MGTGAAALIGRERELDLLRRALAGAAEGRGQAVLIEGEAGIGKTRLVREFTAEAASTGFDVREGSCDDIVSARPFAPFAQAFRLNAASDDDDRRNIASLLEADTEEGAVGALTVSGKQFRVIELLGALVEKLAEQRPLCVVVEDVHWADRSTLAALRSVMQRVRFLPVLIVATMRPGYDREELHRAVDALVRDGATRLVLAPLSATEVETLAAELLGAVPELRLLERLEGATGNPLFVHEYVDALRAEPDADAVPLEFRVTVLRRIGQLSDDTNQALRVAAVLGSTFAAADLATALGATPVELSSRLQQAMQSGFIGESGDRLAFRHDLVRDAIYEHIPLDLRRQLHREVAHSLAEQHADPLVVAHHLSQAAESFDEEAAEWLRRAAADVRLRAPGAAAALLERAIALLPPQFGRRDEYLVDLVMPLAWAGRLAEAEALGLELLERRLPPELAGPLRCGLVYALTWQGKAAEALAYTELRDGEVLSPEDAVLLDAEGAIAGVFSFDFMRAAQRVASVDTAARSMQHDLALCHALSAKAWVLQFTAGQFREAVEACREAIEIADRSEHGQGHLAHPRFFPGISLINLDRLDEAQAVLQRGRQISEELGLFPGLPMYHSHLGVGRFIAGDWDAAVAELETCLRLAEEIGTNILVTTAAAAWLSVIFVRRDDLRAAERVIRRQLERAGPRALGFGLLSWARAMHAEATSDVATALGHLEPGYEAFFRAGARNADPWTALALTRLLLDHAEPDRAREVVRVIEENVDAEIASSEALALRCRGLVEADATALLRAVDRYRASPRRVDLADTLADLGLQLIDDGRAADAHVYLDEALEIYDDLGAARDVARVRAALRKRGIARGARGRRGRASSGWESLTETELKVVGFVAQRLSNPEVAERLFVSRHTIESHLKNIYRKLDIGSRGELAAQAAARSVVS